MCFTRSFWHGLCLLGEVSDNVQKLLGTRLKFMKNKIGSGGEMIYEEPSHKPSSKIVLEVLLDSLIALSACPQDQTPTNGWNCSEMKINIRKKK